jgi:hypothetical protein
VAFALLLHVVNLATYILMGLVGPVGGKRQPGRCDAAQLGRLARGARACLAGNRRAAELIAACTQIE